MNDIKFFQISADFDLTKKPDWFDNFRLKYDLPYDYHITLKTTTNFKREDFDSLGRELKAILDKYKSFSVVFGELFISQAPSGWCIMIRAKHNEELFALQKEIAEEFSKYGDHTTKERASYEKDFNPHITIARHLDVEQLEKAKSELKEDLVCEALIDSITLRTVKEDTFEEWSNPENMMIYGFKK